MPNEPPPLIIAPGGTDILTGGSRFQATTGGRMHVKRRSPDEGFTLLELMAVVLVLGILVSIAVATYRITTVKAQLVTCQTNQQVLNQAVLVFEQQNKTLPDDIEDLRPFVKAQSPTQCPTDGRSYILNKLTGQVSCPNHTAQ